jgi:ribosomal-protein-alanine N-acetyltransferase
MTHPELETSRLKLVRLSKNHLEDLFKIYSSEQLMKYWDDYPHSNIEKTKEVYEMLSKRETNNTGVCWAISLKDNREIIGTIAYNGYKKNGLASIGYILKEKFWNKGYTTEALTKFIDYGFSTLNVHRIEAHVSLGNIGSEKVLQKVGFIKEGVLRERVFFKDKHQSLIVYGLLKSDKQQNITQK